MPKHGHAGSRTNKPRNGSGTGGRMRTKRKRLTRTQKRNLKIEAHKLATAPNRPEAAPEKWSADAEAFAAQKVVSRKAFEERAAVSAAEKRAAQRAAEEKSAADKKAAEEVAAAKKAAVEKAAVERAAVKKKAAEERAAVQTAAAEKAAVEKAAADGKAGAEEAAAELAAAEQAAAEQAAAEKAAAEKEAAEEAAAVDVFAEEDDVAEAAVAEAAVEAAIEGAVAEAALEKAAAEAAVEAAAAAKAAADKTAVEEAAAEDAAADKKAATELIAAERAIADEAEVQEEQERMQRGAEGHWQTQKDEVAAAGADVAERNTVDLYFWEDACQWLRFCPPFPEVAAKGRNKGGDVECQEPDGDDLWKIHDAIASCDLVPDRPGKARADEYGETALKACWAWRENEIYIDIIVDLVLLFHQDKPKGDGAVLIFLPGCDDIAKVSERLYNTGEDLKLIMLHSLMTPEQQREAFDQPPEGFTKIIMTTDTAEASVTIDDVVYVIDCGVSKEPVCDPDIAMSALGTKMATRANAIQRRGRAGRAQEGLAVHLFPSYKFDPLEESPAPQIITSSMDEVVLQSKFLCVAQEVKESGASAIISTAIVDVLPKADPGLDEKITQPCIRSKRKSKGGGA